MASVASARAPDNTGLSGMNSKSESADMRGKIFDTDGSIKGVKFSPASGKRPDIIAININRGRPNPLTTGFSVEGKDFWAVYKSVVHMVAAYYGVIQNEGLVSDMLATADLFLTANGLRLEPVVIRYEQVVRAD